MISKGHSGISVTKQCKALSIHRSGFYYKPKGESELNLELNTYTYWGLKYIIDNKLVKLKFYTDTNFLLLIGSLEG